MSKNCFNVYVFLIFSMSSKELIKNSKNEDEKSKVKMILKNFDYENCFVNEQLEIKFSTGITHNELRSVANVICLFTGLKLNRLEYRYKSILIKWFYDNWNVIKVILPNIFLLDEEDNPITLERELKKK